MISAAQFVEHFLAAYIEARKLNTNDWKRAWGATPSWSGLMIWQEGSVIRLIAPKLGLVCHSGEPLRLDAVFHRNHSGWSWFPMMVAIEHENAPSTFRDEIQKLLSVRCRLKVGITYSLRSDVRGDQSELEILRARIADDIRSQFELARALPAEHCSTEYLFLVGSENNEHELTWYKMTFPGDRGPETRQFERA